MTDHGGNKITPKTTKVRIAVVCPNYGLVGGAESFAFELTERLAKMEHFEIHVFANRWREGNSPAIFHKVPIIKFPRWARPVSFAWFAEKAIKAGNFDIVHSHERLFSYDFLTHHGFPHKTWVKEIRKKRLSLFDRATAGIEKAGITSMEHPMILPVSSMGKNHLLGQFDIPDSRITVIHPGITVKKFTETDAEKCRDEIRRNHGLADDDIVILFVGMNFDVKGLDRLLKAVADFTEGGRKHPTLKLLIVGKGDDKKYSETTRDLKISDRVVFAGVSHNVEKYYPAGDFFAMPSYLDSFGIVVLEAMASGLPVIISNKVGAFEVVEPGITGYIVRDENFDQEMTDALSALMDQEKRKNMGENAKRVALCHDWDFVAEKIAGLYMQRLETTSRSH